LFIFFKVLKRASPFAAPKVTKVLSAERLLCRTWPLRRKAGRTTGWNLLPYCRSRLAPASAKVPMPCHHAQATMFCPLSPEAGKERKRPTNPSQTNGTTPPNAALTFTGSTALPSALTFIVKGAAASFFFGYFLFCGKKESNIHRLNLTYCRS
jgi:hypothetical protein